MLSDVSSEFISLTAKPSILDVTTQSQDWGYGVSLSAMGLKKSAQAAIRYKPSGFSIAGGRYSNQIDFDAATNRSEQLILDFEAPAEQATIKLAQMRVNEWRGMAETGKWTTYDSFGNILKSGLLDPKDNGRSFGRRKFSFDIDSHKKTSFSRLVIEATAYDNGKGTRRNNNSDFSLIGLNFKPSSATVIDKPKSPKPKEDPLTPSNDGKDLPKGVQLWSELNPSQNSQVFIAKGETLILDTDTANLGGVIVEGDLIFSEKFKDTNNNGALDFTADWLLVRKGGYLEVGTAQNPYAVDTTITLDGADQNVMGMGMGGRFIIAAGKADDGTESTISMHGVDSRKVSWTQLSDNVRKGDTVISLSQKVNWEVGDEIVVAPSGFDATEAERRTITAVNGNKITLNAALEHDHFGKIDTVDGKRLDMRAEVGLLSRNIDIQGAEDSMKSEFGAHMMFMQGSSVKISGVEIRRGGQIGKGARYPIHWHKGGDHEGDYVKDSSIYDSFQRGIVTHGVNNVQVDSNVVYNVFNHAYTFSEDGDEVGNSFTNNLSVLVKNRDRSDFSFPVSMHFTSGQAEHRASGFWGRNYYNPLIGNHSAGAVEGNGFFIDAALLTHENKQKIIKSNEKNIFRDNLAHSNMMTENATNPHYGPLTRGHGLLINSFDKKSGSEILFEDFTTYKNNVSGVWIEDDRHVLRDAVIADSASGIVTMRSSIENVVMTRSSTNKLGGVLGKDRKIIDGGGAIPGGIHVKRSPYGVNPNIKNVTFQGFDNAIAIHKQTGFGEDSTVTGSKLIDIDNPVYWDVDERKLVKNTGLLIDLDGSLTGTGVITPISVKSSFN